MVLIVAGCGHGSYRVLLVPLVIASDAVLGAVSGIVGRYLLIAAWG
jgi:hypothetical protein